MDQLVYAFCEAYERANGASDFAAIGDLYAETFLFAGPHSAQPVRREDFLKVIPSRKAQFVTLGLADTRLASVEASELDSRYFLARVRWGMTLRIANGGAKNLDVFASYILQRGDGDKLSIVFQLDHQDLASVIADATREGATG